VGAERADAELEWRKENMDRKAVARETLDIMEKGYYEVQGRKIDIKALQERSVKESFLLTPAQGEELLGSCVGAGTDHKLRGETAVRNCSTVDAVLKLAAEGGKDVGVLNFASAKNPGGGFINGAMAQEESIAVSSCLYRTLTVHEEYYSRNRVCKTMMYTDHAIYSPEVVFFRDGKFRLIQVPVTASVLTLPAVNMGQVVRQGEDVGRAEEVMKRRMKLALAVFARQGCRRLVLGAYGCGVFRNDPAKIAAWWKELLEDFFSEAFDYMMFAVLDHSVSQDCIRAFQKVF